MSILACTVGIGSGSGPELSDDADRMLFLLSLAALAIAAVGLIFDVSLH